MSTTLSDRRVLSPESVQLLGKCVQTQPDAPNSALGLCDRCSKHAAAQFTLESAATPLRFCGHHMFEHLHALLASPLASFWISPDELWRVKGLDIAGPDRRLTGDGLTDS